MIIKKGSIEKTWRRLLTAALMICMSLLLCACITVNSPSGSADEPAEDQIVQSDQQKDGGGTSGSGKADPDEPALSEEDVMKIVLGRVPGATSDDISSFTLENDDGRWEYEGSLVYNNIEYEFEIDAQNGNILEWELDD